MQFAVGVPAMEAVFHRILRNRLGVGVGLGCMCLGSDLRF